MGEYIQVIRGCLPFLFIAEYFHFNVCCLWFYWTIFLFQPNLHRCSLRSFPNDVCVIYFECFLACIRNGSIDIRAKYRVYWEENSPVLFVFWLPPHYTKPRHIPNHVYICSLQRHYCCCCCCCCSIQNVVEIIFVGCKLPFEHIIYKMFRMHGMAWHVCTRRVACMSVLLCCVWYKK